VRRSFGVVSFDKNIIPLRERLRYHGVLYSVVNVRNSGKVFVWTIDDLPLLERVRAMGVDGVTSNYPDLFASLG
jgi:glycerophosphoryl diester phosphodiesterase